MGIFDNLFGSKSRGNTFEQTTQSDVQTSTASGKDTQASSGTSTGKTTGSQTAQSQQKTNLLDAETQDLLTGLISQIAGSAGPGGSTLPGGIAGAPDDILQFADLLRTRATGAEGDLTQGTTAILTEARRKGVNSIEAGTRRAAEGAGSNLNSIVQSAEARGAADLETQLAGLEAELGFKTREISTNELLSAFGALTEGARTGADISLAGQSTGVGNISKLADILKGATVDTTGQQTTESVASTEEEFTKLAELIRQATQTTSGQTSKVGSGTTEGRSTPGLLQTISSLFD